ncbi:lysophospholipid acyltransferase family protein [Robertkochia solimangrovi]|uniref:lysophospholipid acyltransferase family protein n=1 Tax=Robertkochia solimangrovi TaxID=2213046 RepID=UPI00117DF68E|nr:lysophospholipid acyltransferase family protein [Robertkochia solimangrovi]TRZ45302.1 lipid A biosynthesis acyltransferase [Robertkochia solimangrovi]
MQLLIYILVYPFLWLISKLPFPVFYKVSDAICFLVYRVFGYRRKVVQKNLRLSFPDKSESEILGIEKRFYSHLIDLFLEMIKSLDMSEKEIKKRMKFTNIELLKKYEKEGRSVMMVAGHYASYEWVVCLGHYIDSEGVVVYAPLSNKYFDRLVQRIRLKHNITLVSRYKTLAVMKEHLTNKVNAMYGFANDQSPQPHKAHYWRNFMGVKVPVFTMAEKLSKEMDLVVMFLDIQKVKRGYYETTFRLITDTPNALPNYQITDEFTEILEDQIRNKPEYYLWTHNRFKHKDKVPAEFQD